MTRPLLSLQDVCLSFGGVQAVKSVSLQVEPGEVLGLIGPNGAGKTTLLNVISGLYRCQSGTIEFGGNSITGMAPHRIARLGIGRTFQLVQPFAQLSLIENVAVGAMFAGSTQARGRADALRLAGVALERVGLSAKADLLPSQITLSNRKRLELARALSTSPRLLLLDEVMAGLNHTEVSGLVELVRDIQRSGTTIIVIEHVMRAILALCSRIAVLQSGAIAVVGEPSAVVKDPRVISAYLGSRFAERHKARADTPTAATQETTA